VARKFEICTALTFLTIASSLFAQTLSAAAPTRPELIISVYDYAYIPTEFLAAAEGDAGRIFRQAGVETVWVNCLAKPEKVDVNSCYEVDATHLMMKILPRAINADVRDRSDVLGDALVSEKGSGFFAYVFYDCVQRIAEEQRLGHALLGDVLAHEIGHLLLGSRSHAVSGIMSAHWRADELLRISEGNMFFLPSQSRVIRDRVGARRVDPSTVFATAGGSPAPPL
jgi:hypothetical protein